VEDIDYTFDNAAEARRYLREVGLLWGAWLVGLIAVMFAHGVALLLIALSLLISLLALAKPLLPRTEALVPVNSREGGALEAALRGGTKRDRVLRELAYGVEPVRAALESAGLSTSWIAVRHIVVAATLIAFVVVVVAPML
jgi:hypothetical protein